YIRPAEFVPVLAGAPLYEITLAACLLAGGYRLLAGLGGPGRPAPVISVFVLGLWGLAILSNLARAQLGEAWDTGDEFFKVVLDYFLVVTILDTPSRLKGFLRWQALAAVLITALAILNYYHVVTFTGLQVTTTTTYEGGKEIETYRLGSSGLFA